MGNSTMNNATSPAPTTPSPTTSASSPTYMKHKSNPNYPAGSGKGAGKMQSKNKAFGGGKINQVCCGYYDGVGDGCSPPECSMNFVPTAVPTVPRGAGKNQPVANATKSKQGSSKVFRFVL